MVILDTTYLIDFIKNHPDAVKKAQELDGLPEIFTTEINVFEVLFGIYRLKDRERASKELDKAKMLFDRLSILPLEGAATFKAANIASELEKQGKPIEITDSITAGIALANGVTTIVTRNKEHFSRIKGIRVEGY